MVHSPSKVWEDGVLVERAIATDTLGDPDEHEAVTNPDRQRLAGKRVAESENKAVSRASTKRAKKK